MGGSFPGIIVPAPIQLSVPQSGNWCGQEDGFAPGERPSTWHGNSVRVSGARYEAGITVGMTP